MIESFLVPVTPQGPVCMCVCVCERERERERERVHGCVLMPLYTSNKAYQDIIAQNSSLTAASFIKPVVNIRI
jgi:hypothetical protein